MLSELHFAHYEWLKTIYSPAQCKRSGALGKKCKIPVNAL